MAICPRAESPAFAAARPPAPTRSQLPHGRRRLVVQARPRGALALAHAHDRRPRFDRANAVRLCYLPHCVQDRRTAFRRASARVLRVATGAPRASSWSPSWPQPDTPVTDAKRPGRLSTLARSTIGAKIVMADDRRDPGRVPRRAHARQPADLSRARHHEPLRADASRARLRRCGASAPSCSSASCCTCWPRCA